MKKILMTLVAVAGGIATYLFNSGEVKYTKKWIEKSSDEVLEEERERIRLSWCKDANHTDETLMSWIDEEMTKRANKRYQEEHPDAETRHREHGWYISKDD